MPLSSISVFLPCYNEAPNLTPMVDSLAALLPQVAATFEIILIDDGSQDQTGTLADSLAKKHAYIRVIHHPRNLGYGMSLQSGFKAARYDWTFFTDSDRQFDVKELLGFLPYTSQYQVIIGYRIKRVEGGLRALNAGIYKFYMNLLFRIHVRDIDCAFKLIKTSLVKPVHFISTGATINAEMLYRLKKMHVDFKQLPVNHYPRLAGNPTGNNFRVIVRAGIESVKIYLALKFGWKFA